MGRKSQAYEPTDRVYEEEVPDGMRIKNEYKSGNSMTVQIAGYQQAWVGEVRRQNKALNISGLFREAVDQAIVQSNVDIPDEVFEEGDPDEIDVYVKL